MYCRLWFTEWTWIFSTGLCDQYEWQNRPYHCNGRRGGGACVHCLHVQDVPVLLLSVQLCSAQDGSAGVHREQVCVCLQWVNHVVNGTSWGGGDPPHLPPRRLVLREAEVVGGAEEGHALRQAGDPQVHHHIGCKNTQIQKLVSVTINYRTTSCYFLMQENTTKIFVKIPKQNTSGLIRIKQILGESINHF